MIDPENKGVTCIYVLSSTTSSLEWLINSHVSILSSSNGQILIKLSTIYANKPKSMRKLLG